MVDVGGTADTPEVINLPIIWVGVDEEPIQFVNQMVSQFQENEFILTFGQLAPPMIVGPPDVQREQVQTLSFVPVRPVVRVAMTADRMRQLVDVLSGNLATYDSQREDGGGGS